MVGLHVFTLHARQLDACQMIPPCLEVFDLLCLPHLQQQGELGRLNLLEGVSLRRVQPESLLAAQVQLC